MVAVINTGSSVRNIFNYNENKMEAGKAELIGEGNYPAAASELHKESRLKLLLKQLELNTNVKRGSVHISLNFDSSESNISKSKLMEIAQSYMEKIGFGFQPYLVYQHHDAGHPHIHIVSVKVKSDGKRIDMQNIGRNQSETARKEIEKAFNLVPALGRQQEKILNIKPAQGSVLKYGKAETKKAIAAVLNAVIPNYKYTTIGELNAVLNLYNVTAVQGSKDSRMFLHKGLAYQILNDKRQPVGVPLKASSFYMKPTLAYLEIKFAANKIGRNSHLKRVKNAVDLAFIQNRIKSVSDLDRILIRDGIKTAERRNEQEILYGLTYIDHKTKCVFNGSSLGKTYSASGIEERCGVKDFNTGRNAVKILEDNTLKNKPSQSSFISVGELQKIIDSVLQPEFSADFVPSQLKRRKKRKKGKGH
ncbi:relaxase/mobilization nuclease domain-containing protein [Flavobacterium johnsoniae]|uniref:relaxase/mobilization nuclease domain-containing protein n=1 Tax=Flavobacterium TaxID=237 RepID=UPI0015BD2644|nr:MULTISPECIES: relaxase/mobilization nuclease domain-containing protein [Flavobacterium]NWL02866.1 relaxase [Flavobacterium collinsii]WET04007.1 relaxase/mobilization nuclease domain-containing protein [Flavobacterium sp. YJ01]WJS94494.1 relaxase/mobilization nuclease domain-containing protein [Flavobacterium johnsoniae]